MAPVSTWRCGAPPRDAARQRALPHRKPVGDDRGRPVMNIRARQKRLGRRQNLLARFVVKRGVCILPLPSALLPSCLLPLSSAGFCQRPVYLRSCGACQVVADLIVIAAAGAAAAHPTSTRWHSSARRGHGRDWRRHRCRARTGVHCRSDPADSDAARPDRRAPLSPRARHAEARGHARAGRAHGRHPRVPACGSRRGSRRQRLFRPHGRDPGSAAVPHHARIDRHHRGRGEMARQRVTT